MDYDLTVKELEVKPEWYTHLVDECQAIITEGMFQSRWVLVETYHTLGERIIEASQNAPIEQLVQDLGQSLKRSRSTLWYAIKFAREFPRLDSVPEGKSITWNKVINRYLSRTPNEINELSKDQPKHTHEWQNWRICDCGARELILDNPT